MKRAAILFALGLALGGCWCKGCQGAETWNNDLIITATEAAEFKDTVEDLWNTDPSAVSGLLFVLATGAEIPTETQTVTLNLAQSNRWFNTAVPGSCMSRIYWHLGRYAINHHRMLRPRVMDEAKKQARLRLKTTAAQDRFIARIEILSPTSEEY